MNDLGRCFPQIMKGQFLRVMLTIEENLRIKTITEVHITQGIRIHSTIIHFVSNSPTFCWQLTSYRH